MRRRDRSPCSAITTTKRKCRRCSSSRGFSVLKDQRTSLTIKGERLDLAGIRFWTRTPREIAGVLNGTGGTTVLLAHDPRRLVEAAALDVQLVLSGHTHGGQVIVPGVGPVARRRFPVLAGYATRDNTSIFVSRGVGTVYVPVRINCPARYRDLDAAERPRRNNIPPMPVSAANSQIVFDALKASGVRLMSALPETWLVHLIRLADDDPDVTLVRLAKEEEGVGISMGAHFAGVKSAMLMQNHGFLAAINGIVSGAQLYRIPLLMVISDRGTFGERDPWQTEGGAVTESVLAALRIPIMRLDDPAQGRASRAAGADAGLLVEQAGRACC